MDRRLGPPLREEAGEVAGSAAEVDDPARRLRTDACQQLDEGTGTPVGVTQVEVGVPTGGAAVRHPAALRQIYLDVKILDPAEGRIPWAP